MPTDKNMDPLNDIYGHCHFTDLFCNSIWQIKYGRYASIPLFFFFLILKVNYVKTVKDAKNLCILGKNMTAPNYIPGNSYFTDLCCN